MADLCSAMFLQWTQRHRLIVSTVIYSNNYINVFFFIFTFNALKCLFQCIHIVYPLLWNIKRLKVVNPFTSPPPSVHQPCPWCNGWNIDQLIRPIPLWWMRRLCIDNLKKLWEGESIISCSFEKEITKIIYSSANDQSAKLYNHEEGPY